MSARTGLPVSIISIAARTPMRRTLRTVPPNPGWMPSCTSGKPSDSRSSLDGDAVAAGEGELEAAAEREAVDRRDGRAGRAPPGGRTPAGRRESADSRFRRSVMPVNSLMSAPATKPLFLAESTTTPRGGGGCEPVEQRVELAQHARSRARWRRCRACRASARRCRRRRAPSSRQRRRSRCSSCLPPAARSGRCRALFGVVRAHVEVAHQRAVIREAHVGHAEIGHLDALAHQDEVELDARHAGRERRAGPRNSRCAGRPRA